jgi:hypothetical protein
MKFSIGHDLTIPGAQHRGNPTTIIKSRKKRAFRGGSKALESVATEGDRAARTSASSYADVPSTSDDGGGSTRTDCLSALGEHRRRLVCFGVWNAAFPLMLRRA